MADVDEKFDIVDEPEDVDEKIDIVDEPEDEASVKVKDKKQKKPKFDDIEYEVRPTTYKNVTYQSSVPKHLDEGSKVKLSSEIAEFYGKSGAIPYDDHFGNEDHSFDPDVKQPDFKLMPLSKDTRLDVDRYEYAHKDYDLTQRDEASDQVNYLGSLRARGFVPYISKKQRDVTLLKNDDVHKALKEQTTWNPSTKTYEKTGQSGGAFADYRVNGSNYQNKILLGGVANRRGQFLIPVKSTDKVTLPTGRHMVNSNITGQIGDIITSTKAKNSLDNALTKKATEGQELLSLPTNRTQAINSDPNFVKDFILNVRGVTRKNGSKVGGTIKKGKYLFQYGLSSQNVTREIPDSKEKANPAVKGYWDELESEIESPSFDPLTYEKELDKGELPFTRYAKLATSATGAQQYKVPITSFEGDDLGSINYNADDIAQDKNVENWKKILFTHHFLGEDSTQSISSIDDYRGKPAPAPAPAPAPKPSAKRCPKGERRDPGTKLCVKYPSGARTALGL